MNENNPTQEKAPKNYQTKYRSILFGSMSMIMMALAIVFYENPFSLFASQLPTALVLDGEIVNDSFLLFILFGSLSVILSLTGVIYAIKNRKVIGFFLSIIVFAGICFTSHKADTTLVDSISKFSIQETSTIPKKEFSPVIEANLTTN